MWLASAAVAAGWAALYTLARWVLLFILGPIHEDLRFWYVAAKAGLQYGWSTIYDPAVLHRLSSGFPATEQFIRPSYTYANPPLLAWLFTPLTLFSEPVAYALWTVISLAAFVWAWHLAAPYSGLAKLTLLFVGVGLWPLLFDLYFGQPDLVVIALAAASWWLCAREKAIASGTVLALATFLKPQLVALVPLALLVSGHRRHFAAWAGACAVLGVASVINLGEPGLVSWWQALVRAQADPPQSVDTLAHVFGGGPLTLALWIVQGAMAMLVAYRRREPEIVFAAGIIGSAAAAFHFHYLDYTTLVLAAWLVLRTSPSMLHRIWLLAGIVPLQLMSYQPGLASLVLVAPQLAWDAMWLVILVAGTFGVRRPATAPVQDLARTGSP